MTEAKFMIGGEAGYRYVQENSQDALHIKLKEGGEKRKFLLNGHEALARCTGETPSGEAGC